MTITYAVMIITLVWCCLAVNAIRRSVAIAQVIRAEVKLIDDLLPPDIAITRLHALNEVIEHRWTKRFEISFWIPVERILDDYYKRYSAITLDD